MRNPLLTKFTNRIMTTIKTENLLKLKLKVKSNNTVLNASANRCTKKTNKLVQRRHEQTTHQYE